MGDQMCEILGNHEGFKNEKSLIERYLGEKKKHNVVSSKLSSRA